MKAKQSPGGNHGRVARLRGRLLLSWHPSSCPCQVRVQANGQSASVKAVWFFFSSLGSFLKPSQRVPPFNYVKATALAHIQGHAYKHKTQTQTHIHWQRQRRRESKEGSILLDFIRTPLIRGHIKLDANRKFILNTNWFFSLSFAPPHLLVLACPRFSCFVFGHPAAHAAYDRFSQRCGPRCVWSIGRRRSAWKVRQLKLNCCPLNPWGYQLPLFSPWKASYPFHFFCWLCLWGTRDKYTHTHTHTHTVGKRKGRGETERQAACVLHRVGNCHYSSCPESLRKTETGPATHTHTHTITLMPVCKAYPLHARACRAKHCHSNLAKMAKKKENERNWKNNSTRNYRKHNWRKHKKHNKMVESRAR